MSALGVCGAVAVLHVFVLATNVFHAKVNPDILGIIIIGISSFVGRFATSVLATRHKLIPAIISIAVLLVLYNDWLNLNINNTSYSQDIKTIITIVLTGLIGGIVGTKGKPLLLDK